MLKFTDPPPKLCLIRSHAPRAEDGGVGLGQNAVFPGVEANLPIHRQNRKIFLPQNKDHWVLFSYICNIRVPKAYARPRVTAPAQLRKYVQSHIKTLAHIQIASDPYFAVILILRSTLRAPALRLSARS